MKNRIQKIVSVVLLIVYGTLTFVVVPLHFHEDPLYTSGGSEQTIVQHNDALHCHHRDAIVHIDCTICSFVSHTAVSKVIAVIPHCGPQSVQYISTFLLTVRQDLNSSHSRRGPPINLV